MDKRKVDETYIKGLFKSLKNERERDQSFPNYLQKVKTVPDKPGNSHKRKLKGT